MHMRRHPYLIIVSLAGILATIFGVAGLGGRLIKYHSTNRYSLRFQTHAGRISILYDGGAELLPKINARFSHLGIEFSSSCGSSWDYITLSFPAWMLASPLLAIPPLFLTKRYLRRRKRKRCGLCVRCTYDLTGNVSGTCPECGSKVP